MWLSLAKLSFCSFEANQSERGQEETPQQRQYNYTRLVNVPKGKKAGPWILTMPLLLS